MRAVPRVGTYPEQHLKLVLLRLQTVLTDEPQALGDQPLVVRRDPDVTPLAQQLAKAEHEVLPDGIEVAIRDQRRLHVDALAEADVRAEGRKIANVSDRPPEVCLEDDADVVETFLAQVPVHPQRVARATRVLHVDPHEVAALGRMADDGLKVPLAEVVSELQAEPGELDAHVRVEVLALDRLEDVVVGTYDLERSLGRGDLLAEDVDRRHPALLVQLLDRSACLRDGLPRDVARRDPLDERSRHRRQEPGDRTVEEGHGPGDSSLRCGLAFAHEALPGCADECDRLGKENAHGVAERDRLLVGPTGGLDPLEGGGSQLDRRVERQRGELLALRLGH